MSDQKILVQIDTDPQASVFDAVVAIDAGVDHLLRHACVEPAQVRDLVYGAMFTRGGSELKNTAIFVGGSDVPAGEEVFAEVRRCFFEHMRVSCMIDSNGSNTTAAAAVLAAGRHLTLEKARALVLAATGPVGARVTRLLAGERATVCAASRTLSRAEALCERTSMQVDGAAVEPLQIDSPASLLAALEGVNLVICAGAAGVQLLSAEARAAAGDLRVAIDLNAVPPLGIEGIQVHDRAADYAGVTCYGAVGVGGMKMKVHKAAIRQLYQSNDQVLDAAAIYGLAAKLA